MSSSSDTSDTCDSSTTDSDSDSDSDTPTIISEYSPPSSMASTSTCGRRSQTSLVPCPASKKPKIDDNMSKLEFIDKFLECSVCLEFPSSPIHSCANAHFLCGKCAPGFSSCPTCQLPKLRPSPVAEKLAKEANKMIQCANFEAGCKDGVLSTKFLQHLPLCYFRDIICNYNGDCDVKVKLQEYTKHLKDIHYEEIYIGPKFTESYSYNEKERPLKRGKTWSPWGQTVVKFKAHEFIVQSQISEESQLYFSWIGVLGDKELADKFVCEVKFKNPKSKKLGCSWTLSVLAFHEISSNESEATLFKSSAMFVVPMDVIKNFGEMLQDRFSFEVTYEIKYA